MRYFFAFYFFAVIAVVSILGFRGSLSEKPPLWIFPDMDNQAKFKPQGSNTYFPNHMDDRPKPANVVLRGQGLEMLEVFSSDYTTDRFENPEYYHGKTADGDWVQGIPAPINNELMRKGQQKYEIFCSVCHGSAGDGGGATANYGINAPSLHLDMFRDQPDGEIYNTINHGKGTMYGYGDRLDPEERWAIVLYVRALQRAQNATIDDIPASKRRELGL